MTERYAVMGDFDTLTEQPKDVSAILPLVGEVASHYSPFVGLEEDEAYSILSLELMEGANDYLILWTEGSKGIIVTRFRQILRMNARADRIKRMAEDCEIRYDPEYVSLFLPFFFDRMDWQSGPADGTGSKPGWRTGDAVDTALDMQMAFPRLKSWQLSVIRARHLTDAVRSDGRINWDVIADALGYAHGKSAEDAYRRAVYQLSVEMTWNRRERTKEYEGVGSRKAISNAAAAAVTNV